MGTSGDTSGELKFDEIHGVPTVWADLPGPLRAELVFRTGAADETVGTLGTTHLLEHLALDGEGDPGEHTNGCVDLTLTTFSVVGTSERVTQFMSRVVHRLHAPPMAVLERERRIIAVERESRGAGRSPLLVMRFGSTGYGLAGAEEIGARLAGPDELRAWAAARFTRGNAVLALTGPPPAGLRLPLPEGPRRPAPDAAGTSRLDSPRAWFAHDPRGPLDLSALVPRGHAGVALASLLERRLVRSLRQELAVAYSPNVVYHPLDGRSAYLVALSAVHADGVADALIPFLDALEGLARPDGPGAVTEEELTWWEEARSRAETSPEAPARRLATAVWNLAHGHTPAEVRERQAAGLPVVADDIRQVATSALTTALLQLPEQLRPPEGWTEILLSAHDPVEGAVHVPGGDPHSGDYLVVGEAGITAHTTDDQVTIPVEHTVAVLAWDDGGRVLVSDDGVRIVVEPTLWSRGAELLAAIDRRWPAHLLVALGARDENDVPQPPPPPSRVERLQRAAAWLVAALALVVLCVGLIAIISAATGQPTDRVASWVAGPSLIGVFGAWFSYHYEKKH